jgi:uncharacterized protein with GYD domain
VAGIRTTPANRLVVTFTCWPIFDKEEPMPAYVTLFNFTEQGLRNIKGTVERGRAASQAAEAAGGRFIGVWWLLGQYDGIAIIEAPDDETATRLLIATGMQGNVRTMSMRAFSEEEMARIVQGLP